MRPNNQSGFSLISVMVSMAILSLLTMTAMQFLHYAMLQSQTLDTKNSVTALTGSLSQVALNNVTCTAAVTHTPQQYGSNIRFDLPNGQVIAGSVVVPTYNVSVSSFTFNRPSLVATGPDGSKVYFGDLSLSLKATRQVIGGAQFAPRPVASIYILVNASGSIVGCNSTMPNIPAPPVVVPPSQDDDGECHRTCVNLGGNYNNGNCRFESHDDDRDGRRD